MLMYVCIVLFHIYLNVDLYAEELICYKFMTNCVCSKHLKLSVQIKKIEFVQLIYNFCLLHTK